MEVEDALKRARAERSSLTRSFWYGKFLQQLPEENAVEYIQPSTHQGTRLTTPVNSSSQTAALLSQPVGGKEKNISPLTTHAQVLSSPDGGNMDSSIQRDTENGEKTPQGIIKPCGDVSPLDFGPHIAEALKCLRHCETSLSPAVYDLIVNSIQFAPPAEHLASISQSSLLLKDCTLDWNIVSVLFNNGIL